MHWRKIICGILICHSFMSLPGIAQPEKLHFEKFSTENGLPNNAVKTMLQDRTGILWMAGADGLARYDGYAFKTFRYSNADSTSISGNNIMTIYEDTQGRLWVCTLGYGIDISNTTKSAFRPLPLGKDGRHDLESTIITEMIEDREGRFWLASNSGLITLVERGDTFQEIELIDVNAFDALNSPTSFFLDSSGRVWIGTERGLYIYRSTDQSIITPDDITGLPVGGINDIQNDRNGTTWVACQNEGPRMYFMDGSTLSFKPLGKIPFQSARKSFRFAFDLDNRLWVAVFEEQVYGYDFRDSTLFLESSVNSDITHERFLRNPFVDNSGNVWLHGLGYLIYRYPKGFRNFQHPFAFHQSNTCIYGEEDRYWFGYREEGVVCVDKDMLAARHFSVDNPQTWIPVNHVQAFLRAKSGNLIIVGFSVITVMDNNDHVIAKHPVGGSNRAIFQDSKDRIWIGGIRGLHLFSEKEGVIQSYILPPRQGDTRNFIQAITEDAKGNIWFASDLRGLAKLDPETQEIKQFLPVRGDATSLPTTSVIDLICDGHNTLWLGTDIALVRFDPETFQMTTYDRKQGLQNDYINAILCDTKGHIWVSTNVGVSEFDPVNESFRNYSNKDGLLNNSFYTRSKFRAEDGTIFFGGASGVDYFHPDRLRINPTPPRMNLSDIVLNNKQHIVYDPSVDSGIKLSHADNMLDISFAGLHYAAQGDVRNFYRIDGMGNAWTDIGTQREVLLAGLKPGNYVFRAKACSSDGIWSEQELTIPISVAPPFYGTLWFRILGICLLATVLLGFVRYRERRVQIKDKKEAEVAQQIRDLERRALQAQMNPHFIYNCMNSIQQFMILHDYEGTMKYLTRFSRLLRTVLNTSTQQRVALSDEIKLIEDYVELENMRFPNKFSYEIEVSPDLNIHTIEIPPFFIQPQIENAIRHGLMYRTTAGHLSIRIDKDGQQVKIIVEDNGVGRETSKASSSRHTIHESKGLSIVQERLAHLHPENGQQSLHITDLYDPSGNPSGTRVEILLPIE